MSKRLQFTVSELFQIIAVVAIFADAIRRLRSSEAVLNYYGASAEQVVAAIADQQIGPVELAASLILGVAFTFRHLIRTLPN